jgi:hypothetical protein
MATNKSVHDLLNFVVLEIPDFQSEVVKQELRSSADEFLRESRAWQLTIGPLAQIANKKTYCLETLDGISRVEAIIDAHRKTTEEDDGQGLKIRNGIDYVMKDKTTVEFCTVPTITVLKSLTFKVAVRPISGGDKICSQIYDDWYDAISYGAKFRLMRMPRKPWTNFALAQDYRTQFWDEIRRARAEWELNYNVGTLKNLQALGSQTNSFVV